VRERNFELLGTFSFQQRRRSSHSKQGEREREFMGFWAFGFPSKKKISPIIKGGGGSTRAWRNCEQESVRKIDRYGVPSTFASEDLCNISKAATDTSIQIWLE